MPTIVRSYHKINTGPFVETPYGLRLLHNEQLFPGQRLDMVLNGQPPRPTEVVWCRRLAPGRYAVTARFVPLFG